MSLEFPSNPIENTQETSADRAEEFYQEKILPIIEILKPDAVSFEEYEEQVMDDLLDGVKKQEVGNGILIQDPEKTIEQAHTLLLQRIHSLLEDARDYNRKTPVDPELVKKSKIVLLTLGDLTDVEKYKTSGPIDSESISFFRNYLIGGDQKLNKLSRSDIDSLMKTKYKSNLVNSNDDSAYNPRSESGTVALIPESLLIGIAQSGRGRDFYKIKYALESAEKGTYSKNCAVELIKNRYGRYVVENFNKFEDMDFEDAVISWTPEYPYNFTEMLEALMRNIPDQKSSDFKEKFECIVKHQHLTELYTALKNIDLFKNILKDFDEERISNRNKENMILSEDEKKDIENGNIGLYSRYTDYIIFLKNEHYEWLLSCAKQHDQEHLLMHFPSGIGNILKPEDELAYAKKLISKNKTHVLASMMPNEERNYYTFFSKHALDQEVFNAISNERMPNDLLAFGGLNEEAFLKFFNYLFEKNELALNIMMDYEDSFNLSTKNKIKKMMKETKKVSKVPTVQNLYFNKFFNNETNEEEKNYVTSLIQEVEKFTDDKDFILDYIKKFEDQHSATQARDYLERLFEGKHLVVENKPVSGFSQEEYKDICKSVYPQRKYNTYKFIDQYENRTKDLDKYTFDRNGYEIKLSGVLGYKIKDGLISDTKIIAEFTERINAIKKLSVIENLNKFLEEFIVEGKAKTTEGKILEYFKQNGYTVDTMNVLLAYQLEGRYDDFVAASTDRVASEQDSVSKNYVLLDELVNQYGDTMKDTIKGVQGKVALSEDRDLFAGSYIDKYQKRYSEIISVLMNDLNKVPKENITNQIIQKKVLKTIKNTFQGIESVQKRADYFASLFSVNDLDNFEEVWNRHINELFVIDEANSIDTGKIEALQSGVYTKLQNEIIKYEEIKEVDTTKKEGETETKLNKERLIKGYFSKNKENAHARMVADVCLAEDPNMLKNEKYFEFVLFDEDREKCVGTTMLLQMDEPKDGKKYLLYCPNPSVGLVSEVSAKKLYTLITNQIIAFSKENNFDGVLVNKKHGHSTNRAGLFQQSLEQSCLKDRAGKEISIDLKHNHALGSSYSYQNNLQIIWSK